MKGYLLVDDTTVNLSGLQLPKSYIKAQFKGTEAYINTNLVVAQNQDINLTGQVNYGKKPRMNLNIFTDKIYFNDCNWTDVGASLIFQKDGKEVASIPLESNLEEKYIVTPQLLTDDYIIKIDLKSEKGEVWYSAKIKITK